ncbi:cellulase family glycosylhydrolase [Calothrix sp. FACHB-1219]|uniref:cellulase family glycosylhydrolase n=1 Tax=unclassified Calothrix TaxID=2619626 RepID=UPI00168521A1|nr:MULTISPECIES: cellulase family glycosylhydrolase [unclassified Calothrix]MBD2201589.1 cellulase family glycosylhydrolase [Calothrix sp. FACHB-168]MBD2217275.1 cellulase family glycosylhydrolase [Calothrix sp. FACHB-1219]
MFKVIGNKIYDPNGKEFVIKGVNVNGPNWYWDRDTINDLWAIKLWKFNTIRINTLLKPDYQPKDKYTSSKANPDLHKIIDTFTKEKIVCIIELHDMTGSYFSNTSDPSLSEVVAYYQTLAARYINNPYVWFNIQNEPGPISNQWLTLHKEVIKYIRALGSTNIVICDGAFWGQEVGEWNNNSVKSTNSAFLTYGKILLESYENIVFSFHAYDQWNYSVWKMEEYIKRVLELGLCLIIGEYSQWNNIDTTPAAKIAIQLANKYRLGRIFWAWEGRDNGDLTTRWNGGGWAIDKVDGSKPTNLNELGLLIWDDNRIS